jgi:phosphoglycerol transferase MdoB-like AlkP superfamily enzyme
MTKSMKITFIAAGWLFLIYTLLRLGFYVANRAYFDGAPLSDIALSFFYGLRYDAAGLVMINAPVLFLYNLPAWLVELKWYKRFCFLLFAGLNAVGIIFNLVDYRYYGAVQRRSNFEPLERPADFGVQIPTWIEEFPVFFFGGLGAVALLVFLMALYFRRLDRKIPVRPGFVRGATCGFVLIVLSVLAVRGGLQTSIMRPADALVYSNHVAVGHMTQNSTYTVLLSRFLTRFPIIKSMPDEEAGRIAASMVTSEGETLLDSRYPFYRMSVGEGPRKDWNVVIFIQESWTGEHVGPDKGGVSRTPFFDSLCKEGAFFSNFFANGQRSSQAVPSIIASLPSLFRGPIIGSRVEDTTRFCGIGDLLGPYGYTTSLHHGASRTMEGFDGFRSLIGVNRYYSNEDFPDKGLATEETWDGKWGIYDELFYRFGGEEFSAVDGPFAGVMFGLQPHDPFHVPPSYQPTLEPYAHETPYQRAMRYSDFSLESFFAYARTQPWFEKTLFFITADHTRFSLPGSFYQSFHIPLLVYAPALVEPQVRPEVASHADILPTILDLLEISTPHGLMGRSLFDLKKERYAVLERGGRYVIFDDTRAHMNDLQNDLGLFDYRKDLLFADNLAAAEPEHDAELKKHLLAWLQAVTTSIVDDKIWPRDALEAVKGD